MELVVIPTITLCGIPKKHLRAILQTTLRILRPILNMMSRILRPILKITLRRTPDARNANRTHSNKHLVMESVMIPTTIPCEIPQSHLRTILKITLRNLRPVLKMMLRMLRPILKRTLREGTPLSQQSNPEPSDATSNRDRRTCEHIFAFLLSAH